MYQTAEPHGFLYNYTNPKSDESTFRNELNHHFIYKSDEESMFKGVCRKALQQQGISQYFVEPSTSGPFKTKLGVVERFHRTIKLYLNKFLVGNDSRNWATHFSEAL